MTLRKRARRLMIDTAAALGLDALERWRERREMRRRRTAIVRVFFLHGSPPVHADRFRRQLSWLGQQFNIIDFNTFKRLVEQPAVLGSGRPAALLTFDDGFASNYEVAAPLLEEAGLRGLFFVVPRFSASRGAEARRLYHEHIRGARPPFFAAAMTPAQMRELADRGHAIGNHTLSHRRLSDVPEAEYVAEVVEGAAIIESWIGHRVEAFAWPLAWNAITPAAYRLACERHRYCFAPCAGRFDPRVDSPQLIWRSNLEPHHDVKQIRFQCSPLADRISAGRRRQLIRFLSPARPGAPPLNSLHEQV